MGYSLNQQQDNVTIAGNTTLTRLPDGPHQAKIYANNIFGKMGASEFINFTVAE
jgi:hypothetical protein